MSKLIPLTPSGTYDLKKATLEEIRDEFAGRILQGFVESGGEGLRSALWVALNATLRWKEEQDKLKR